MKKIFACQVSFEVYVFISEKALELEMHIPLSSAELMDCQLEQHLVRRMEILRGAQKEMHRVQKRVLNSGIHLAPT